jgi:hypothetical protein
MNDAEQFLVSLRLQAKYAIGRGESVISELFTKAAGCIEQQQRRIKLLEATKLKETKDE